MWMDSHDNRSKHLVKNIKKYFRIEIFINFSLGIINSHRKIFISDGKLVLKFDLLIYILEHILKICSDIMLPDSE